MIRFKRFVPTPQFAGVGSRPASRYSARGERTSGHTGPIVVEKAHDFARVGLLSENEMLDMTSISGVEHTLAVEGVAKLLQHGNVCKGICLAPGPFGPQGRCWMTVSENPVRQGGTAWCRLRAGGRVSCQRG